MGVSENESNLSSGQRTENRLPGTGGLDTLAEELIWDKPLRSFFFVPLAQTLVVSWDLASIMLGLIHLSCFSFSLRG